MADIETVSGPFAAKGGGKPHQVLVLRVADPNWAQKIGAIREMRTPVTVPNGGTIVPSRDNFCMSTHLEKWVLAQKL